MYTDQERTDFILTDTHWSGRHIRKVTSLLADDTISISARRVYELVLRRMLRSHWGHLQTLEYLAEISEAKLAILRWDFAGSAVAVCKKERDRLDSMLEPSNLQLSRPSVRQVMTITGMLVRVSATHRRWTRYARRVIEREEASGGDFPPPAQGRISF